MKDLQKLGRALQFIEKNGEEKPMKLYSTSWDKACWLQTWLWYKASYGCPLEVRSRELEWE